MVEPIANGEALASVKAKIADIIDFGLGSGQSAGLATWGHARAKLNQLAASVALPSIGPNDSGLVARGKINGLLAPLGIEGSFDLLFDFTKDRYFRQDVVPRSSAFSTTRSAELIVPNSQGVLTPYAANVAGLNDLGLWTAPTRTNKCTNRNANPADTAGLLKFGDAAATLAVVDDVSALAAAGLSSICTSGKVVKLDNSTGTGTAIVEVPGTTSNLNPHALGITWRGSGQARLRLQSVSPDFVTLTSGYTRYSAVLTPTATNNTIAIWANPGAVVYFILNQLEEGSFATDPIGVAGSSAIRPGDQHIADMAGLLGQGVAGYIKFESSQEGMTRSGIATRVFEFNDGTINNRLYLSHLGSQFYMASSLEGVHPTGITSGNRSMLGQHTIAFAAGPNFLAFRRVGDPQITTTSFTVPSLSRLNILCRSVDDLGNTYGVSKKLALWHSQTINQALFNEVYAKAEAA